MAHQIPHILIGLLLCGILGGVALSVFFTQSATMNSSVSPFFKLIPLVVIPSLIIGFLIVAVRDRD